MKRTGEGHESTIIAVTLLRRRKRYGRVLALADLGRNVRVAPARPGLLLGGSWDVRLFCAGTAHRLWQPVGVLDAGHMQ